MMTNEEYQKIFKEMSDALYKEKENKDKVTFEQIKETQVAKKDKIKSEVVFETHSELLKKQYNVFTKENEEKKQETFKKVVNDLQHLNKFKNDSVDLKENNASIFKLTKKELSALTEDNEYYNSTLEDISHDSGDDYADYSADEFLSTPKSNAKPKKRYQRRENKKLRKLSIKKDIYNSITNKNNSLFKRIGSYIFDRVELIKLSTEDKEQYHMAASFIEHNMLDKVVTMQANGYELPNRLQGQFDEKIFELIQDNPLFLFEKILKEVGTIPKEYLLAATFSKAGKAIYYPSLFLADKVSNNHQYGQAQMIIHKFPHVNKHMVEIMYNKEFLKDLNNFAVDVITHTTKIITSKNFSKQEMSNKERIFNIVMQESKFIFDLPGIWQEVTLKEYLEVIKSFKDAEASIKKELKYYNPHRDYKIISKFNEIAKNINELIVSMSSNVDKLYSSVIDNTNRNTKSLEKGTNENIENNQKSNETYADFPKEAQDLIKKLYNNYSTIKNEEKNFLEIIDFNEVEIIISKRLPDIVKKYRAVNNEYKHNMLNVEGKNATQLLIESLRFLDKSLVNYMDGINEAKVSSLSASKRHSEEIFQQSIKSGRTNISKTQMLSNGQEVEMEIEEEKQPDIKISGGSCRI